MDILDIIGETTECEKKQEVERKKVKNWLKSVSAFANTIGGAIVFGITNDDACCGVVNIKDDLEFVSQKIKERITPFPEVSVKALTTFDKKNLLIIHVPEGRDKPYYYVGDGVISAYIRIGNESVISNTTELNRLILLGRNKTYDGLISPYRYEDFSFTKLKERYKLWNGIKMDDKFFESYGIRDSCGNLTNAGALLADESPIYCSKIFCTRWNGKDKSGGNIDALDSAEYTGSLIILLNEGIGFIKRNMKTILKKLPQSRIELPDYCERSVFEALVNALIHRDYLITGSEVHIDMYDDRLTIYSPGGMPDGSRIQERNIGDIPSTRRNPVLADIFERLGYMERKGSGLSKILVSYESSFNYKNGRLPYFCSDNTAFTVTLPNLNIEVIDNGFGDESKKESLNESKKESLNYSFNRIQIKLIHLIQSNPDITQKEMMQATSLSRSTIQRKLEELIKCGYIKRTGSRKKGKWLTNIDL